VVFVESNAINRSFGGDETVSGMSMRLSHEWMMPSPGRSDTLWAFGVWVFGVWDLGFGIWGFVSGVWGFGFGVCG